MTDSNQKPPKDRLKDWRDIGRVEMPMDKISAARSLSSCCVGVEAVLDPDARFRGMLKRVARRRAI